MSDHTEAGIKLVTELKQNKLLPKFNNELVNEIGNEITKTYVELAEMMSDPNFDRDEEAEVPKPLVMQQTMNRNIRCAMAYMGTRLDRLHRVAWESGKAMPDHIAEKITPAELNYYKDYLSLLDEYGKSCAANDKESSTVVDLTVDLTPPKELFIEVRIKKDYGSIMLPESGEVLLHKNTTHLLRRSEVDHLIKQGIVAEVL
jgi:GINS complex subunit 1